MSSNGNTRSPNDVSRGCHPRSLLDLRPLTTYDNGTEKVGAIEMKMTVEIIPIDQEKPVFFPHRPFPEDNLGQHCSGHRGAVGFKPLISYLRGPELEAVSSVPLGSAVVLRLRNWHFPRPQVGESPYNSILLKRKLFPTNDSSKKKQFT